MKQTTLFALPLLAIAAGLAPAASHAELTYNVGAVSDYRYRGISQSRVKPAVQGGLDFSAGGFYLGAWASTIKWIKDAQGHSNMELDLYGGYKGEFSKALSYDVGVLSYVYPDNHLAPDANTAEVYGALTFGMFTAKYSHALTNTFANQDSKNSGYLELAATVELGDGWTLAPHIGHQRISGPYSSLASYTDYSLTLSKDFKGWVPSVMLVSTDADKSYYWSPVNGKETGKSALVVGLKYNF